jgi:hypothetical protein
MISDLNSIIWKRGYLKIRDCWYDEIEPKLDADVVYVMQRKKPEGEEYYEQYTILIDLQQSEEKITGSISKNCIDKIKRISKKPEYRYELITEPNKQTLKKFILQYNAFAASKNIAKVEELRLNELYEHGLVMISVVYNEASEEICWHVYRVNKERVFLIYTFTTSYTSTDSTNRNNLGMVNRNCHYNDLLEFKKLGIKYYDFGGWYKGDGDREKLNINKFKEEFGGSITENYNCIYYPSFKGKVFKAMKKLRHAKGS